MSDFPDYDGKVHALSAMEREYHRLNGMLNDAAGSSHYPSIYAAQQALAWAMDPAGLYKSPTAYFSEALQMEGVDTR